MKEAPTHEEPGEILRPLGATEAVMDGYARHHPLLFTMIAEISGPAGRSLSPDRLTAALADAQAAHPLLTATIVDTPKGPAYRRSSHPIAVQTAATGTRWVDAAVEEQTAALPPRSGPLVRARLVLADGDHDAAILMTFSHQVTDARGALLVLRDVLHALDGDSPVPSREVPQAQERLLADLPSHGEDVSAGGAISPPAPHQDEGPARVRPWDSAAPCLDHRSLGSDLTAALIQRCKDESTTVQSALCAAATLSLAPDVEVTVNVPIDLRRAAALPDEVVVRLSGTVLALSPADATSFWDLARAAGEQLHQARALPGLVAEAGVPREYYPVAPEQAETALAARSRADVEITNLGYSGLDPDETSNASTGHSAGSGRTDEAVPTASGSVAAVWGPVFLAQIEGERVIGAVTHGGELRLVLASRRPTEELLTTMQARLHDACRQ